jgi:hypothetical protein
VRSVLDVSIGGRWCHQSDLWVRVHVGGGGRGTGAAAGCASSTLVVSGITTFGDTCWIELLPEMLGTASGPH